MKASDYSDYGIAQELLRVGTHIPEIMAEAARRLEAYGRGAASQGQALAGAPVAQGDAVSRPPATTVFGHALQYATAAEKQLPISQAACDVLAERQRQISAEGWTPEHDDDHSFGELARAGAAYAAQSLCAEDAELECDPPTWWPWDQTWWKPKSRRGMLVKAGALVLAELERLDRAARAQQETHHDQ